MQKVDRELVYVLYFKIDVKNKRKICPSTGSKLSTKFQGILENVLFA